MAPPPAILLEPGKHDHLLSAFANIHVDCVETDYTLATFLPPFDHSNPDVPDKRVTEYWKQQFDQVRQGGRAIVMQIGQSHGNEGEGELMGYVSLNIQSTETGPFRGSVEKLLVSPRHRKQGVAKNLMARLELVARERGTNLLCLDTEVGSPAEMVYPRLGYTRIGAIPGYGISPKDGRLVDEVFFYKDLRKTQ